MQIQYGQRGGRSVGTAGCLQRRLQRGDIGDTAAGTAASAKPGRILAQPGSAAQRWQQGCAQPWSVGPELGRHREAVGQQRPRCAVHHFPHPSTRWVPEAAVASSPVPSRMNFQQIIPPNTLLGSI